MKLFLSPTSPFARLVLVTALEHHLKLELEWTNAWESPKALLDNNPHSMIPTLVLDSGESLFESGVIVLYLTKAKLDDLAVAQRFAKAKMLLEMVVTHLTLARFHPEGSIPHPFIERSKVAIERGLQQLTLDDLPIYAANEVPDMGALHLAISLDCVCDRLPEMKGLIVPDVMEHLSHYQNRENFVKTTPIALESKPFSV